MRQCMRNSLLAAVLVVLVGSASAQFGAAAGAPQLSTPAPEASTATLVVPTPAPAPGTAAAFATAPAISPAARAVSGGAVAAAPAPAPEPECIDLLTTITTNPNYTLLTAALEYAGLDQDLSSNNIYTVIAPIDDAIVQFLELANVTLTDLEPSLVADILTYHLIPSIGLARSHFNSLTFNETFDTVYGSYLNMARVQTAAQSRAATALVGTVAIPISYLWAFNTVTGTLVTAAEGTRACNGYVYPASNVLLPESISPSLLADYEAAISQANFYCSRLY